MSLNGKVVMITGAASGIGRRMAAEFAKEKASVIAVDISDLSDTINEIDARNGIIAGYKMDVTKAQEIQEVIEQGWRKFGRIDILINNAGICPSISFVDLTEDIWDLTMRVNLKGTFLCSQIIVKKMIDSNTYGKIINITSDAVEVPPKDMTHYSASKGGVHSLTLAMAKELAPYGINVNAISPSGVPTNIFKNSSKLLSEQGYQKSTYDDISYNIQDSKGKNRELLPDDIAKAAVFLSSENADLITGAIIKVHGFKYIMKN